MSFPERQTIDTTSPAGSQGTSGDSLGEGIVKGAEYGNVGGEYENVATTAVVNPVEATSKKLRRKLKAKAKRQDTNGDGADDGLAQPENPVIDTTAVAGSQGTSSTGEGSGYNNTGNDENIAGEYENVATTAVVTPVEETSQTSKSKRQDIDGDGVEDFAPLKDGMPLDVATSVDSPKRGGDFVGTGPGIEITDGQTGP